MVHYINKYKQTPQLEQEIKWKTLNLSLIIFVCWALLFLLFVLITGGIYGINEGNTPLSIYSFVMAGTILIASLGLPFSITTHFQPSGQYFEVESQFGDKEIHVLANGKTLIYNYHQITKIKETKNFYLLFLKRNSEAERYLAVKKEFTTQSEGFFAFIKKKQKIGN